MTQTKSWWSWWCQCVVTQPEPWCSCWCQRVVTWPKSWCSCWCQSVVTQPESLRSCWCLCVVTQPTLRWTNNGWKWRLKMVLPAAQLWDHYIYIFVLSGFRWFHTFLLLAVCCSKAAVHGTRTEWWTSHQLHCRRRLHCCPWPWWHGRKGQTLGSQNRCVLNCFDVRFAIPDHALPCCIMPHCIIGAGIAQWLEHQTHDWKVAGSNPCTSGGRIFFSRVNFLWWLFILVTAPPLFYCSSM